MDAILNDCETLVKKQVDEKMFKLLEDLSKLYAIPLYELISISSKIDVSKLHAK